MRSSRITQHQYTNPLKHNNSVALLYEMIEKVNTDPDLVKAIIDNPSNHYNFKPEELKKNKKIKFTQDELNEFDNIRIQRGAKRTFAYLLEKPEAVSNLLKPEDHKMHFRVAEAKDYLKDEEQAKIITYLVSKKIKLSDIKQSKIKKLNVHQVAGKKTKKYRKKSRKSKKSKKHHKRKSRNKRR